MVGAIWRTPDTCSVDPHEAITPVTDAPHSPQVRLDTADTSDVLPFLSVIICTCDRADSLRRTLQSLIKANDPGCSWEMIVVVNGSHSHTAEVLSSFARLLPLRSIVASPRGANIARNAGIREARGELLLFSDDDVTMPKDWLAAYVMAAQNLPDRLVFAGPIQAVLPAAAPSWLLEAKFAPQAFGHLVLDVGQREFKSAPFGANFGCRRQALQLASFDETRGPNGTTNYLMGSETSFLAPLHAMGHVAINVGSTVFHHLSEEMVTRRYLRARAFRYSQRSAADTKPQGIPSWLGVPRWLYRQAFLLRSRYWLLYAFLSELEVANMRWDMDFCEGQITSWLRARSRRRFHPANDTS